MLTKPKILLHLQGAFILALSVFFYHQLHASWLLFAILFLTPDLFMLGYLANVRIGSAAYNFAHTYITPGILLAIACLAAKPQLLPITLIWTAHIGFDRLLGFGLKISHPLQGHPPPARLVFQRMELAETLAFSVALSQYNRWITFFQRGWL
jgi:hypothetical protein